MARTQQEHKKIALLSRPAGSLGLSERGEQYKGRCSCAPEFQRANANSTYARYKRRNRPSAPSPPSGPRRWGTRESDGGSGSALAQGGALTSKPPRFSPTIYPRESSPRCRLSHKRRWWGDEYPRKRERRRQACHLTTRYRHEIFAYRSI